MSDLKLQLDEFFITRLNVEWLSPPKSQQVPTDFQFTYDVARHKTDLEKFRLVFYLHTAPSEGKARYGYVIDCAIAGLFSFVDRPPEKEMQTLIRINGCTILYGILRGQIALITGSFLGGKFNLPTVMMQDVVKSVEAEKAAARDAKTLTPPGKANSRVMLE
jgi:preprotein translocase subunit SecB